MKHLILSLDTNNIASAKNIVSITKEHLAMIKIGHIMLSNMEKQDVLKICQDVDLMLDMKFHDIQNTILTSIANYKKALPNLKYFTYSCNVDSECIRALANSNLDCLGVAVLILSSSDINEEKFIELAIKNYNLGINNFICPPVYIEAMRAKFGDRVTLFSPGIRGKNASNNDHKESKTAQEALKLGGNYTIVGRPLLSSNNPQETIKEYI